METLYYGHAGGVQQAHVEQVKETPIQLMGYALNRVPDLRGRINALAEKLCGAVPSAVGSEGKIPAGQGGLLGVIEQEARDLNLLLDEMHDALTRIERGLP